MFREALAQRQSRPGHAAVPVIPTGAGLGSMLAGSSEPSTAGEIKRHQSAIAQHVDRGRAGCDGRCALPIGEALSHNITVPPTLVGSGPVLVLALVGSGPVLVLAGGSQLVEEFDRAANCQARIHEYNHQRSKAALADSHLSAAFTPPGEVQSQRSMR
jgi:hypothetical protein